ncbi:MAG: L-threonylcarbamoyladenylate synthase [Flavobacteriaceae bacterium]|nr:L-threonylcarbamoyladenylate synthase [Flavobacteriaceae bacterium]MCY4216825.1 L-threonylcarbamoyladenylate synthase [Flavobacteriaceae bacterium]
MYIQEAVQHLKEKNVILYPTDTIWGLGGDATSDVVADKIYHLKQRPQNLPFIILVDSSEMLKNYVQSIPNQIQDLVTSMTPTTIIYPEAKNLASKVIAEDGSIGIRIIKTKFCRDLIHHFGKPIISTSANLTGQNSPKEYTDIDRGIIDKVDYIVPLFEWTGTKIPSKVVRVGRSGTIEILRH